CKLRLDFGQPVQSIADQRKLMGVHWLVVNVTVERRDCELIASLNGGVASNVIDNEPTHYTCGVTYKAGTIRETGILMFGDIEIRFVKKRRYTKSRMASAPISFELCQAVQLKIQTAE